MKKFQILNKDGIAISMSALDAEAAEFWGKKVDDKRYANPYPEIEVPDVTTMEEYMDIVVENARHYSANWFDIIGWNIANQGHYTTGWNNVIHTMMSERIGEAVFGDHFVLPNYVKDKDGKEHMPCDTEIRIKCVLDYYKPFVDLIKYWEKKGYKPVSLD